MLVQSPPLKPWRILSFKLATQNSMGKFFSKSRLVVIQDTAFSYKRNYLKENFTLIYEF